MSDSFALFIGAVIILFFSYDRFNIATYGDDSRIDRLVTLVSPDKLRAKSTVLKAFVFYAAILVFTYFFLCAYAELLPLLGGPAIGTLGASSLPDDATSISEQLATGFEPSGDGRGDSWSTLNSWGQIGSAKTDQADSLASGGLGIDPSVSLTMALIMVGLAPTFPLLKRFDEWVRGIAHSLAGIPTWVRSAAEVLQRQPFKIYLPDQHPGGEYLLISAADWKRLHRYHSVFGAEELSDSTFLDDLELILAASSWLLEDNLRLSGGRRNSHLGHFEQSLFEEKENLIQRIDGLAHILRKENEETTEQHIDLKNEKSQMPPADRSKEQESWLKVRDDTANLAGDFCILIALYDEHGLFTYPVSLNRNNGSGRSKAVLHDVQGPKPTSSPVREKKNQQTLVLEKLATFTAPLRNGRVADGSNQYSTTVWLWTVGLCLSITFFWSLTLGAFETALQRNDPLDIYTRAAQNLFIAFNSFGLPLLIALAIRDSYQRFQREWQALFLPGHWPRWLPQVVVVFLASWLSAVIILVGVSLWQSAIEAGWNVMRANAGQALLGALEYNAPFALRGAALSTIVLALLDAHRKAQWAKKQKRSQRYLLMLGKRFGGTSGTWAMGSCVIMGLVGAGTRVLSFFAGSGTMESVDGRLSALIIYAVIYNGLIGLTVIYCVSEVIFYKFRERDEPGGVQDSLEGKSAAES